MEVCQFCKMYMKPFMRKDAADCEFCGAEIAVFNDGKWEKVEVVPNK